MQWRPRSGAFFLASIWIPAIIFTMCGGFMEARLKVTTGSLGSFDCLGFEEKRELRRAYEAAHGAYNLCVLRPGYETAGVDECPEYKGLFKEWPRQLKYLQDIERRLPCAGICGGNEMRLFHEAGVPARACGPLCIRCWRTCIIRLWRKVWRSEWAVPSCSKAAKA